MKDKSFFSNATDLRQKLNGTIIKYKGEPHYCEVGQDEVVWLSNIHSKQRKSDGNHFAVSPDDRDLDYSSPILGFANHGDHCTFVGRLPARRSVQGISESNVVHYGLDGKELGAIRGFVLSDRMYDCIMGKFPSFTEIYKQLISYPANKEYSQAFARHFAVRKTKSEAIFLYHRLQQIGQYDRMWARFTLIPTYNNSVIITQLKSLGVPVHES